MTKIYEYLDEVNFFISDNEAQLGGLNLARMKTVSVFAALLYIAFAALSYALFPDFRLHVLHAIIPLALLAMWRVTDLAERKLRAFQAVRFYMIGGYACLFVMAALVECILRKNQLILLFPILLIVAANFYLDYFRVVALFELLVTAAFLAADFVIKEQNLFARDLVIATAAYIAALFGYAMVLGTQTEVGRDRRLLKQKSDTDLLTGLFNKIAFESKAKSFLAQRKPGSGCVLLIFDFDNFKLVNDHYGHQTGDEVLQSFARTLESNFRVDDIVGRVGGDEFMVLMTGDIPEKDVEKRCYDILHELRTMKVGKAGGFSASIGVALDDGTADFDRLYKVADEALYVAKDTGKARFVKKKTTE